MVGSASSRSIALSALAGVLAASVITIAGQEIFDHGGHGRTVFQSAPAIGGTQAISTAPMSTAQQIYREASPSVVAIQATAESASPFGSGGTEGDSGTGFVVNPDGLILTNDHVINGATNISVSFNGTDGPTRNATVVGTDPSKDLALLRVDPSGLTLRPLHLGDSSKLQVGDSVYAIGDPYGLDQTLTTGIVSALGRTIQAPDGANIDGAVQTDAALNPGNSGGPLLDASGQVIGVNSQIATGGSAQDDGQAGNSGVGFAISSNTLRQALSGLEHGGTGGASTGGSAQSQPGVQTVIPQGNGYGNPYGLGQGYGGGYGGGFFP
ncbi:MAG TPA: trypsin-like peptidase domain-containing protein [Solirubrobacteraceae bacterium]|jgi:putative serine protease PepD|nr:trypsin-like peptidase domain-containing protein [Solirubrobacteraceae bacterium]